MTKKKKKSYKRRGRNVSPFFLSFPLFIALAVVQLVMSLVTKHLFSLLGGFLVFLGWNEERESGLLLLLLLLTLGSLFFTLPYGGVIGGVVFFQNDICFCWICVRKRVI